MVNAEVAAEVVAERDANSSLACVGSCGWSVSRWIAATTYLGRGGIAECAHFSCTIVRLEGVRLGYWTTVTKMRGHLVVRHAMVCIVVAASETTRALGQYWILTLLN